MTTQTKEQLDLDQMGQQAYGSIIAAKKHDLKGANLWLSAGLLLIEAKAKVGHGKFGTFLRLHKISDSSAAQAMRVANSENPHKEASLERAKATERKRTERASPVGGSNLRDVTQISTTQPSLLDVRRLIKSATEAELLAVKELLLKLRAIAHEETT
ncbi:MAG TPA: hypothetical protein VGL34_03395 [Steroidobacteraceae bacterium]|jgi:hypothetical protein